ncbi:hypothetical protein I302_105413 [Kwoniella bestiolae CBS 10118]|uniref:Uncharacterized protein n=1 Tax=Kwoniella bestiolae CBS 10118 TaxID=1296100 RepID=A0A1B9FT23_9TREE|nr:hypothetical protein I302_08694 [Kwoniella bestiolae CBS 10118]OCF21915.1 hypothetical protein I302_08694 [Kwoniella bestiolae CBS 10118]
MTSLTTDGQTNSRTDVPTNHIAGSGPNAVLYRKYPEGSFIQHYGRDETIFQSLDSQARWPPDELPHRQFYQVDSIYLKDTGLIRRTDGTITTPEDFFKQINPEDKPLYCRNSKWNTEYHIYQQDEKDKWSPSQKLRHVASTACKAQCDYDKYATSESEYPRPAQFSVEVPVNSD